MQPYLKFTYSLPICSLFFISMYCLNLSLIPLSGIECNKCNFMSLVLVQSLKKSLLLMGIFHKLKMKKSKVVHLKIISRPTQRLCKYTFNNNTISDTIIIFS